MTALWVWIELRVATERKPIWFRDEQSNYRCFGAMSLDENNSRFYQKSQKPKQCFGSLRKRPIEYRRYASVSISYWNGDLVASSSSIATQQPHRVSTRANATEACMYMYFNFSVLLITTMTSDVDRCQLQYIANKNVQQAHLN